MSDEKLGELPVFFSLFLGEFICAHCHQRIDDWTKLFRPTIEDCLRMKIDDGEAVYHQKCWDQLTAK